MRDVNFEKMVVVTAPTGEKYLGWLPKDVTFLQMDAAAAEGRTVTLKDVRHLLVQRMPDVGPDGQVRSMRSFMALLPVDMFPGPAPEMKVKPCTWYAPSGSNKVKKDIIDLIEAAEANELANKAAEANLVLPRAGVAPQ
jgi:hypothetical protein